MGQPTVSKPKSELEILEARTHALAGLLTPETDETQIIKLVAFHNGEEWYGIEIAWVREVQPLERHAWSPVPCTPDFITGATSIRGRIYSVLDIGRFLRLPPRPLAKAAHVLLVQGRSQDGESEIELAVLADAAPQVASVPLAGIQPPPATISAHAQAYVRGVTGDMLIVLDLERMLSDPGVIVYEHV